MNRFYFIAIVGSILLLALDSYVFKGIRLILANSENIWLKKIISYTFWGASLSFVIYLFWIASVSKELNDNHNFRHFYNAFGLFVLLFVPKLVFGIFHLMDDITFVISWVWNKFIYADAPESEGIKISRAVFLTRVGLVLAAIPFAGIIYGILKGKYDFRVIKKSISFTKLPKSFDGFTLVQISDAHLGSFLNNKAPVEKAIKMINDLKPDLIVFTGDLVNNYADEAEPWISVFSKMEAKFGKFSILGNHDYGDYVPWESPEAKSKNLDRLKAIHHEMGFKLLLNEHVQLSRNNENIVLAGIENWGKPPFPQHGDLNKALHGTDEQQFKVLLSHDPSHWDLQVLRNTDIDLSLAGHTHGMQFGIEIAGIKWSPVKYKYPRWGGLYKEGLQHLYVNRGFGFLGFPGRVGMPPEITMIELRKA